MIDESWAVYEEHDSVVIGFDRGGRVTRHAFDPLTGQRLAHELFLLSFDMVRRKLKEIAAAGKAKAGGGGNVTT
jgi:hypothetical protein